MRKTAAIYARISSDPDHDELGVNRQLTDCRQLAAQRGIAVLREYVDDDRSAWNGKARPAYREMLIRTADLYVDSPPEEDVDAWPQSFAQVISAEIAAHRLTKQPVYLDQAQRFASMAVEIFWQDNPLPRASMKTGHYEAITGGDSLALALLEVAMLD